MWGTRMPPAATRLKAGVTELLVNQTLTREDRCDLARIDAALDRIALAAPAVKRTIINACRGTVAPTMAWSRPPSIELLRAIADTLDCPLPPKLA